MKTMKIRKVIIVIALILLSVLDKGTMQSEKF